MCIRDSLLSDSIEERAFVVAEYGKEVRKIEPVSYTHLDVYKRQEEAIDGLSRATNPIFIYQANEAVALNGSYIE